MLVVTVIAQCSGRFHDAAAQATGSHLHPHSSITFHVGVVGHPTRTNLIAAYPRVAVTAHCMGVWRSFRYPRAAGHRYMCNSWTVTLLLCSSVVILGVVSLHVLLILNIYHCMFTSNPVSHNWKGCRNTSCL